MKKTILALLALTVVFAFTFTACNKDPEVKDTEVKVTPKKDLIIQKKGWELFSATSVPAFVPKEGTPNSNLFDSFFYGYELDDILFFYENGSSVLNFGKKLEPETTEKDVSLGNWRIIKDDKVLEFHLPYFLNEDDITFSTLEADIAVLNETTMTLIMKIEYNNGEDPVKGKVRNDRGARGAKSVTDYTMTFTYKVAK